MKEVFKLISDSAFVFLFILVIITHLVKVAYLIKPFNLGKKWNFLGYEKTNKLTMLGYYLLTILVGIEALYNRILQF